MSKLVEVTLILLAGAIGGLVSVIDAWQDPVSFPLTFAKLASLFVIPVVKGALAAGIGVYLLTTVDAGQIVRAFFFAATCGLTFPAILSNGSAYAQRITSQVANSEVAQNTERLRAVAVATSSASTPAIPASGIERIKSASLQIVQASPKLLPAEAKVADEVVQSAVAEVAKSVVAAPDTAAVDAIGSIGAAAAARQLPLTRDVSLEALKAIEGSDRVPPPVKLQAAEALKRVQSAAP